MVQKQQQEGCDDWNFKLNIIEDLKRQNLLSDQAGFLFMNAMKNFQPEMGTT